jgi:hypothetical protein
MSKIFKIFKMTLYLSSGPPWLMVTAGCAGYFFSACSISGYTRTLAPSVSQMKSCGRGGRE